MAKDNTPIISGGYKDLSLVIEGLNMPPGTTLYSPYYDALYWVRSIICYCQSDQQYDCGYFTKDSSGRIDASGYAIATNQSAFPANYRPSKVTGVNALIGYSAKFYLKNSSASTNNYSRLCVQLIGL